MHFAQSAGVVLVYLGVLWLPGLALAYALRARGWTLVGAAPLATYGMTGVLGPLLAVAGVPWSAATYLALTALLGLVAVVLLMRNRHRRWPPTSDRTEWSTAAHVGVAGVLVAATMVGGTAIARAMSDLSAVPQDWDAVFHANGIRFIADTGNSSLYGMSQVNWFEASTQVFYPNAYHLVGSVVYQLTGVPVTSVLNAHTLLIPGLAALSLVVVIRRMGGRAVLAGGTAVVVVGLSTLYDMLWRGPLLPYATGVALTPLLVVLLLDLLDCTGPRSLVRPGLLFGVGLAGLICLQPASLLGAMLFAAPPLVQRWWTRPWHLAQDLPVLLVAGGVAAGFSSLQLVAGLATSGDLENADWPADLTTNEALGQLLTFSHAAPFPQVWIMVAGAVGLLTYQRLGDLRWVGAVAAGFGVLFLASASSDALWANSVTQFWWNDRWRLAAPAAIALAVIAGHGLAEIQRRIVAATGVALQRVRATHSVWLVLAGRAAVAVLVLLGFAALSEGDYVGRNAERMSTVYQSGPALTPDEVVGFGVLAGIAPPGRVLNDRGDGTAWMYALTGVHPVAGHFGAAGIGPDTALLANRFNAYPDDPTVRAAVGRLGVEYVILSDSFQRSWAVREPGLVGLDQAPWLERVYRNSDVTIYRIRSEVPPSPARAD